MIIKKDEVKELLNIRDGYCHVFSNPNGMLMGADWSEKEIDKAISESNFIEKAGEVAMNMNHGICIDRKYFIETNDKFKEFLK